MTPRPRSPRALLLRTCTLALVLVVPQPSVAADAAAPHPQVAARRISGSIVLDGRLEESDWAACPAASGFVQAGPNVGAPATEKTEARVLYDDDALYVGMRMFDSAPDSVVGQVARRDFTGYSDWAHVIIDSYYDRRTAFRFSVNPKGVEKDVLHWDDTNEDIAWDAVWRVATRVDSLGWVAEIRIPFSQLRFSTNATADASSLGRTWGINFMRSLARRNERAYWSPEPPNSGAFVSLFGDLTHLENLKAPGRLEILPYTVGRVTRAPGDPLDPFYDHTAAFGALGGDLKYGVTSNLTLTATVNPDFGQVEADPSVVNLSAFETFFPEKRPFFLEGASFFRPNTRFPYGIRGGSFGNDQLFYSRRIGRVPQAGLPGDAAYVDMPDATTILSAAKLSGKTGSGWTIGTFDAVTARETAPLVTTGGERTNAAVEPLTNYAVARVSRDANGGQSAVGLMGTAVNRNLGDEAGLSLLRRAAYAGGLDARHRFGGGNFETSASFVGSHIEGSEAAIQRAQRSSARYFQRPDAPHLTYDPTRTSLSGYDADVKLRKINGRTNWRWELYGHARSPGFEINDLGFMRNADWLLEGAWLSYGVPSRTKAFNNANLNLNHWGGWSYGGERRSTGFNTNGGAEFHNAWRADFSIDHDMTALSTDALRGGPALRVGPLTNWWVGSISDARHSLNGVLNLSGSREWETGGHSLQVYPEFTIRPSTRVQVTLGPGAEWNTDHLQFVAAPVADDGGTRYLFGTLEQRTVSLTTRINYTFTPTLSLQAYAQPFISAGAYSGFKEVADPRAPTLGGRFHEYGEGAITYDAMSHTYTVDREEDGTVDFTFGTPDFRFAEMRSNVVLRWEYRPGSALFVVWSQGRDIFNDSGRLRLGDDVKDLFESDATDVLLVKVSYWIDV